MFKPTSIEKYFTYVSIHVNFLRLIAMCIAFKRKRLRLYATFCVEFQNSIAIKGKNYIVR